MGRRMIDHASDAYADRLADQPTQDHAGPEWLDGLSDLDKARCVVAVRWLGEKVLDNAQTKE